LGTGNDAEAAFVNHRGDVAGASYTNAVPNSTTGVPTMDPFIWYGGKMRDLGTLGGTYGFANGLSNHGEVVGQMNLLGDSAYHPFLWQNGKLNNLGTLGGSNGYAAALNDAGTVVGRADISPSSSVHHAFRWQNGKMQDLGVPYGGGPCSIAYSINSRGQIVGDSGTCTAAGPSFLWQNGTMYNLVSLVQPGSDLTLEGVRRINDSGEISCEGTAANSVVHACLLVPLDTARRKGFVNVNPRSGTPKTSQSTRYTGRPLSGLRYATGPP
jgi:probable HAF family extracellular repeat protein